MAFITPAEAASRLGAHPSAIRRVSAEHDIGIKINNRMRVYTEEDIAMLGQYVPGKPGRPRKLSESLDLAAAATEERAARSIREGWPEAAELDQKLAGHLRRLAGNHRESGNDPEQES